MVALEDAAPVAWAEVVGEAAPAGEPVRAVAVGGAGALPVGARGVVGAAGGLVTPSETHLA